MLAWPGACRRQVPREAFGLTRVDLAIDAENLAKLNATVWAQVPVSGQATIGGRTLKAAISYSGKSTVDAYKKSYELEFTDGVKFRERRGYRLYAAVMDSSGVKSTIGYRFFGEVGVPVPALEPVVLYVNGELRGLYSLLEPVNREFLEARGVVVKNLVKMQYGNADFSEANLLDTEAAFDAKGDPEFLGDIRRLVEVVQRPPSPGNLADLGRLLAVEPFLRYMAAAVALNHWDGFKNNIFLYRERRSPTLNVLPWDLDRLYDESHNQYRPGQDLYGVGALCAKLMSYPELRHRYHAILRDVVTRIVTPATLTQAIDAASARIAAAFAADPVMSHLGRTAAGEAERLKAAAAAWRDALVADLTRETGP